MCGNKMYYSKELFTPYKIRVTTIECVTGFDRFSLFVPYKIRVTTIE